MPLTDRKRQILELLLRGYSNKEIAAACHMDTRTVKGHFSSMAKYFNIDARFFHLRIRLATSAHFMRHELGISCHACDKQDSVPRGMTGVC